MIEFNQDQHGEYRTKYVFQRRRVGEFRIKCDLVEQSNHDQNERIDDHKRNKQYDEYRCGVLEPLVSRQAAPMVAKGCNLVHLVLFRYERFGMPTPRDAQACNFILHSRKTGQPAGFAAR